MKLILRPLFLSFVVGLATVAQAQVSTVGTLPDGGMKTQKIPDDAAGLLATGAGHEREGRILAAFAVYQHALRLHPKSKELRDAVDRLKLRIDQGEKDGSIHVDRRQPPTQDPEVMFKQAQVYVKYGLGGKAIEQLERVLEVAPQHAEAKALLVSLRRDAGS